MLKRINWKAIFTGIGWAVCLCGLVVLMSFINVKKQEVKCTDVKILIPGADNFIEREEIDAILKDGYGKLTGRFLEDINTHEIEERISTNPYIAFVKVYADMDGVIRISVKQRQPILRVINAANQDFYIDSEGSKMPVSANFTANVLVATGNIMEPFTGKIEKIGSKMLSDLYKTALFIRKDTLWNAQIEQIYVNGSSDIELVPRVGIQKIILGNADQLEIKMMNLLVFYKQAMPKVGWDTYKTINIKYTNQIICEKNMIDSSARATVSIIPDSVIELRLATDSAVKNAIADEVKNMQQESKEIKTPEVQAAKTISKVEKEQKVVPVVSKPTTPKKVTETVKIPKYPVITLDKAKLPEKKPAVPIKKETVAPKPEVKIIKDNKSIKTQQNK